MISYAYNYRLLPRVEIRSGHNCSARARAREVMPVTGRRLARRLTLVRIGAKKPCRAVDRKEIYRGGFIAIKYPLTNTRECRSRTRRCEISRKLEIIFPSHPRETGGRPGASPGRILKIQRDFSGCCFLFFSRYRRGRLSHDPLYHGASRRWPIDVPCAEPRMSASQEIARKKVSSVAVASTTSNRAAKRKLRMLRYRCAVPLLPCVRRRSRKSARARASNYSPATRGSRKYRLVVAKIPPEKELGEGAP